MRRRFQIGMGVNPSLIINKGIYIQHVDGGLYTKENWSNKGYSNDLCNGIALVDKVCFVIATEYIGTFSWGKDGRVDNVFAQNSSYMETVKRIIGGVKIRMRILNMIPVMKITLLIKLIAIYLKWSKWICRWRRRVFLISLYANEINECLLMVGGTIMSNKMWTSTQSTQFTYSWYYDINIQGDHLDTSTRSNPRYVRPFTELIL